MKKILIIIIIMINLTTVNASNNLPKYKIVANSNNQEDIEIMYCTKDNLINDYKKWVKSIDDVNQALIDHTSNYNAKYIDGVYLIVLGEGKGKCLKGTLRVSYCVSSKDIKKKSLFEELFK